MNRLFAKFRGDIWGLAWVAGGIFISLALISYNPTDPSFNSIGKSLVAKNSCGYLGSFLADLLYQSLGLCAWVLVLATFRMAWRSFAGLEIVVSRSRWITAGLLLVTCSSLLSLYVADGRIYSGQIRIGGVVGHLVSSGLIRLLNSTGVAVILWAVAAALLVFYTEKSLREIFYWPEEIFKRLSNQVYGYWQRQGALKKIDDLDVHHDQERAEPKFRLFSNKSVSEDKETNVDRVEESAPQSEATAELEVPSTPTIITGFFSSLKSKPTKAEQKSTAQAQRRVENWELPKINLLDDPPLARTRIDEKEIKSKAKLLVEKLNQFSVRGEVVGIRPGPAVTLFEFKPAADVKISKITDLADDLSLALSSESVRIIAPIPGRDVVGIETSNAQRESVYLKDIIDQSDFWDEACKLPMAMGRKADGEPKIVDLRKMPHMLVAGSTGSGKSVFVVSLITGLLLRHSPKTLKLILVDPKQVDLAAFSDLPHLIMPPIREPRKAVSALRWAIREMEKRYRSMSKFGARGLESFNEIVSDLKPSELTTHQNANAQLESPYHPEAYYHSALPYIVIVIEEFGDLMAVDKNNVEQAVVRLAQMARACGIHLVLAMQSPRKDVITGLIKTNIPGRVSFKVASKMDSRIILDEGGAERLLARGDMLYLAPGVAKPERHHGPFLSEAEIGKVVKCWRDQGEPEYDQVAMKTIDGSGGGFDLPGEDAAGADFTREDDESKDEKYDEILSWVATQKEVSASLLQRKFRLGYPRAARTIEIFEAEGVVGPAQGSKPRQVLVRELK